MRDQLHIAIDVTLDEQIHGELTDGAGRPTPFSGWLGLIGQLDELLASTSKSAAAGTAVMPVEEEQ